jgi:hypothetical protein
MYNYISYANNSKVKRKYVAKIHALIIINDNLKSWRSRYSKKLTE